MGVRIITTFIILFGLLWGTSCRKDFAYAPSSGNLSFSKDTVYLDTVFTTIGSSTYSLKVYNNSKEDVLIPNISLKNGSESYYRLNVDGVAGTNFTNIPLYAKDSLFIFIETTINTTGDAKELLYVDAIEFDKEHNKQSVELVTLAKDAFFLFPKNEEDGNSQTIALYTDETGSTIEVVGFNLNENEFHFTNEKPYVIYGYAIIPQEKELIIDAGARVHFHKNSGVLVSPKAKITINGNLSENVELLEGEVIFEGDRLEPSFSELPGQWGGIWISEGSTNNTINHLTLKNAQIGLFAEGEPNNSLINLNIKNSQIYNSSFYNVWAKHVNLTAENLVLGGAGSSTLLIENGGNYDFTHCTISNYWNKGFRSAAGLVLKNTSLTHQESGFDLEKANFNNSIIDGNTPTEISFISNNVNSFNFSFKNCFIKYASNSAPASQSEFYNFSNTDHYKDIINNGTVDYYEASKNDVRIGLASDVIDKGDVNIAGTVPKDILGTQRNAAPDLGAYQAKEKETPTDATNN